MQYTGLQYNDTSTTLGGILQDIYFLSKTNVNSFPAGDVNRIVNKYYFCHKIKWWAWWDLNPHNTD